MGRGILLVAACRHVSGLNSIGSLIGRNRPCGCNEGIRLAAAEAEAARQAALTKRAARSPRGERRLRAGNPRSRAASAEDLFPRGASALWCLFWNAQSGADRRWRNGKVLAF